MTASRLVFTIALAVGILAMVIGGPLLTFYRRGWWIIALVILALWARRNGKHIRP